MNKWAVFRVRRTQAILAYIKEKQKSYAVAMFIKHVYLKQHLKQIYKVFAAQIEYKDFMTDALIVTMRMVIRLRLVIKKNYGYGLNFD